MNSFRGDRAREFTLSPNAVLQLFVDISYADKGKVDQGTDAGNLTNYNKSNDVSAKSMATPSKPLIPSKELIRLQNDNKSSSNADVPSEKGIVSKAGESSGIVLSTNNKSQNTNTNNVTKKKRNI